MDWPTGIRPRGKGLEIEIWKGRKRIYQETVACDPYSPADLAAAVRRRDDKLARYRSGLPLHSDDMPNSELFSDVAQRYLNDLQIGQNQIDLYTRYLNNYWMPAFGAWLVRDIKQSHIKSELAPMKVKIKTQKNRLVPLQGVLDYAGVHPNPAHGIKWSKTRRRAERPRVDRHKPEQRQKVIARLDMLAKKYAHLAEDAPTQANKTQAHWAALARVYFPLIYATGLRPGGEVLGLDWTDYDGEHVEVWSQRSDSQERSHTKTGDERTVFVPEWVRPRLDAMPTRFAGEAIFLNLSGEPLAYTDELNKIWAEALKGARLRHQDPYICRHTRAAELLSLGIEPMDSADQLGHSLQMFLNTYSELIDEYRKNRNMERFNTPAPHKGMMPHKINSAL